MSKSVEIASLIQSLGAVEGRVQTVPNPEPLTFVLFAVLDGRAVACALEDGNQEMIHDAWGHRALVEGLISRDGVTGRPVSIQRVSRVALLADVEPGSLLRAARGVAPAPPDAVLPELAIRALRDE